MDEVYIVTVRGERLYLWRAVDQESLPQAERMLWVRGCSRYSGAKTQEQTSCVAIFQETDEKPRPTCTVNRNGQIAQLWCGEKSGHAHFNALP
jgi:hypothetical protein